MSASLAPECNEVKEKYDTCFLSWYSETYLRRAQQQPASASSPLTTTTNTTTTGPKAAIVDTCAPIFASYKSCLEKALKAQGLDKMIADAREDVGRERDREYLRPEGR